MLTKICEWIGYTMGTNADIDKIIYVTASIIIIIFTITIISLINRILNIFLIGIKEK